MSKGRRRKRGSRFPKFSQKRIDIFKSGVNFLSQLKRDQISEEIGDGASMSNHAEKKIIQVGKDKGVFAWSEKESPEELTLAPVNTTFPLTKIRRTILGFTIR